MWALVIDGEVEFFATREKARAAARVVAKHPTNKNARAFGPYKNVDGIARVHDARGMTRAEFFRTLREEA